MAKTAAVRSDDPPASATDTPTAQFAELRTLLVGPEQRQLRALQTRLDDPVAQARDVSRVLPAAVELRTNDPHLKRALAPTIEESISASVRRNPQPLADALFPIIGPAIRKAIAATLSGMLESLNTTLEHSLSWRSVRWRLDARRTGKSFAEIRPAEHAGLPGRAGLPDPPAHRGCCCSTSTRRAHRPRTATWCPACSPPFATSCRTRSR